MGNRGEESLLQCRVMRAVVQRVSRASVTVAGNVVGEVGEGLLVLAGVTHDDIEADAIALAEKIGGLRIFGDEEGKMNHSVSDVGGACLVVPQFTLYGSVRRGRRPSFSSAADPDRASVLVDLLMRRIEGLGVPVAAGRFGAMMDVELLNHGPVTLIIETREGRVV